MKGEFSGPCIGGPYKGRKLASLDSVYPMSLMTRPPIVLTRTQADDPHYYEMVEIRRGYYEFADGIWWWRGWERGPQPD